jgi:hypothetical protein
MSENTNTNTLRQADNVVTIEGLLLENRIETKDVNGKAAITGEIDIETAEGSAHTIRVFSYAAKQDGSENGIYKGLLTVMNEYKSVAKVGRDEADKVRITVGNLGVNEYFGQDGQLKSFPQLSTNFINRVQANEEYSPKAEFEVEIIVQSVTDEVVKEEETGRAKVKAFLPVYGGKLVPIEFIVADSGAVDYIKDNYTKGATAKIFGDIINHVEVTETEVEVGFGKPQKKVSRKTVREFVITGGTPPYNEDNTKVYNVEVVKKALTEREVYLEQLKNRPKPQESTTEKKDEKKVLM